MNLLLEGKSVIFVGYMSPEMCVDGKRPENSGDMILEGAGRRGDGID